jgi:hypothetical protein
MTSTSDDEPSQGLSREWFDGHYLFGLLPPVDSIEKSLSNDHQKAERFDFLRAHYVSANQDAEADPAGSASYITITTSL